MDCGRMWQSWAGAGKARNLQIHTALDARPRRSASGAAHALGSVQCSVQRIAAASDSKSAVVRCRGESGVAAYAGHCAEVLRADCREGATEPGGSEGIGDGRAAAEN